MVIFPFVATLFIQVYFIMIPTTDQMVFHDLKQQGLSLREISRQTGRDRKAIAKYLALGLTPPRYKPRPPRPGKLDPFKEYLKHRLDTHPGLSSKHLFRELKDLGYQGSYTLLNCYLQTIRKVPLKEVAKRTRKDQPAFRRRGLKPPPITLTDEERTALETAVRKQCLSRAMAERYRIVLSCADGLRNTEVAAALGLHHQTVGKWRRRFVRDRTEGLYDTPRPGRPRTIADEKVAEIIEETLATKPTGATHWSLRSMARKSGLSPTTVGRIWRAFGLQPHRSETFKLSTDPHFVDKVRDIVGLYMTPPDRALVLSVDEKSRIQALERTQPILPMVPGVTERRTHDYKHHGTTSLFAALDTATGRVVGKCYKHHRSSEFLDFLRVMDNTIAEGLDVHMIMDNYATHKTKEVRAWLARRPHWHVHFTPTSASWINQIERWFAELSRRQLQRGVHRSVEELESAIMEFIDLHNDNPKPFKWTKSADDILASVKRFCHKINPQL